MVRTSAPVGFQAGLSSSHGNVNGENIQTNLNDAQPGPSAPDIPELGTTLKTHDLNGELVKENLSDIEGANDNVEALMQYNKL
jgi:hypothetical protein